MTSDATIKLDAETQAYNRKMKMAGEKTKEIAKHNKGIRREWERQIPFLDKVNSGMGRVALQAGAIGAMVGAIAKAWLEVEKNRKAALSAGETDLDATKRLAQVATSQKDALFLANQARLLSAESGISTSRAANVVFTLRSAGDLSSLDLFRKAALIEPDIENLTSGTQTVASAFRVSSEEALNKLLAASRQSKFSVAELAQAAGVAGKSVAGTGSLIDEFLAIVGSEFGTKSADVTATSLRSLAKELTKNPTFAPLRGGSLAESVRNIQQFFTDRNIAEGNQGRFFGSIEAFEGFMTTRRALPVLAERMTDIGRPILDDIVARRDPRSVAFSNLARAKMLKEISSQPEGIEEANQEVIAYTRSAVDTARDLNFIRRGATGLNNWLNDLLNLDASGLTEAVLYDDTEAGAGTSIGRSERTLVGAQREVLLRTSARMADAVTELNMGMRIQNDSKLNQRRDGVKE